MYKNILLISDGPFSCYLGGDKPYGSKRCLLTVANLFFHHFFPGPSSSVSEDVQ